MMGSAATVDWPRYSFSFPVSSMNEAAVMQDYLAAWVPKLAGIVYLYTNATTDGRYIVVYVKSDQPEEWVLEQIAALVSGADVSGVSAGGVLDAVVETAQGTLEDIGELIGIVPTPSGESDPPLAGLVTWAKVAVVVVGVFAVAWLVSSGARIAGK